jgi:hypothetical protein
MLILAAPIPAPPQSGFEFQLPGPWRRVFTFKPSSVQSLWSAVQALFKVMEGKIVGEPRPFFPRRRGCRAHRHD